MVRKKVDNRIRVMIENNVKTRMRSFFVVVGDKAKDQVRSPPKSVMLDLYYFYTCCCYYMHTFPHKYVKRDDICYAITARFFSTLSFERYVCHIGCHIAPHNVEGRCEIPAHSVMVLQKRLRFQQVCLLEHIFHMKIYWFFMMQS